MIVNRVWPAGAPEAIRRVSAWRKAPATSFWSAVVFTSTELSAGKGTAAGWDHVAGPKALRSLWAEMPPGIFAIERASVPKRSPGGSWDGSDADPSARASQEGKQAASIRLASSQTAAVSRRTRAQSSVIARVRSAWLSAALARRASRFASRRRMSSTRPASRVAMRAGYFSSASFRPLSTFVRIVVVAVWYFPSSSAAWASRFAARSASVFFARDSSSTRSCFAFASICFDCRPQRTLSHSAAGPRSRLPRRTSRSMAVHSSRAFWAASFLRPPKIVFDDSSPRSSLVRAIAPSCAPLSWRSSSSPSGTGLSSVAAAPALTPHLVRKSFAFAIASSSWLPHSA